MSSEPLPTWVHDDRFEVIDLALAEESRQYAANGRARGGLGSLNVTLQSEPNFGWTQDGNVPDLLWPAEQAKIVSSPNLERLLRAHAALDPAGQREFEDYLLSHLDRRSPYAAASYLTFVSLHRMQRTADALGTARSRLKGDAVAGYSNVLGTLSALVSHEHGRINGDTYREVLQVLNGDDEHDFRLREKINLARLEQQP